MRLAVASALAVALTWLLGGQAPQERIAAPLLPGKVIGRAIVLPDAPGLDLNKVATRHRVFPSKVERLQHDRILVDDRRIEPRFHPWVDGIVINVPEAHVYLVRKGELEKSYPAGVSRSGWTVPLGQSKVVDKVKDPTWYVPRSIQEEMKKAGKPVKKVVPPGPGNPLGSRWIGFADGSYGLHGTDAPDSLKDYRSHGCVRLLESDVEDLFERVEKGTPVRVYYQPIKMASVDDRVYLAVHRDIYDRFHRQIDPGGMVRALATEAGVLGRIDWGKVGKLLGRQDALVHEVTVGRPGQ